MERQEVMISYQDTNKAKISVVARATFKWALGPCGESKAHGISPT